MSLTDINTRIARQPAHARDAGGFPMSYLDDLKHDLADKAYREAYLEAVRADNDCNDQTMILAYRDVVAALEAQLAATEARECRTREALKVYANPQNWECARCHGQDALNCEEAISRGEKPWEVKHGR